MPSIRPADAADIPALCSLNRAFFSEDSGRHDSTVSLDWPGRRAYFEELVADADQNVVSLAIEIDPIGYFVGRIRPADDFRIVTTGTLEHLYVVPEHRNNGVGTALAQAFLAWAHDHGATRATVTAYTGNAAAIRFYQRHGFTPNSTTMDRSIPA